MRCPSCDHDNRAERRFCAECGAALATICAACGASNEPGEKFCGGCGERLPTVAPAPGAPTPTVEPEGALPAGERRQLTVLFCDLVGSTEIAARLDPEEWSDIAAQYQRTAADAVTRFGGHVAKYLGDGLVVYFGYPRAHDDDPERAVRAGLAIVDAIERLRAEVGARHAVPLQVRVGMHTGPVVIGQGGGTEVEIFGETPNLAARLQAVATPDTVVISAPTLRLVRGIFVIEELGPRQLKGFSEPVLAYRVVQPSGVRSRLSIAEGRLAPFVGRHSELGALLDCWERVQERDGQTVLITGEAGVGKSRLVLALRERLAGQPHTWLECRCSAYTHQTAFHPVIDLVTQGLAFDAADTPADKIAKLERALTLAAFSLPETVPLFADFLSLPLTDAYSPLTMHPDLQRRKTLDALAAWNLALGEVQPVVVLMEDLHWCDPSSLELLGRLIDQSPTARVMLVCTTRPNFTAPWRARSNLTPLHLARLTKRQAREMVVALSERRALPEAVVELIVGRADGIPLYVEELTRMLLESELLVERDGLWDLRGPLTELAIPATLQDSLMARLDRLSAAKDVAQRASVLGREVPYTLLAATAGVDEPTLRQGLARLVEAELLFQRGEPPAAVYTFKHALIQKAAYESLLKRARQRLHARVAQALVEQSPAQVGPEVVARHYEAAGLIDQAVTEYRRAGEQTAARSAHEEAINHLRSGIALLGTLPEGADRDAREVSLQLALGSSLIAARGPGHPETGAAYNRMRALCLSVGNPAQRAAALFGLSNFHTTRGEPQQGVELALTLLALARETADPDHLVLAHVQIAVPEFCQGKFASSLAHCERGIAIYDRSGHRLTVKYGRDHGVAALGYAAWNLWSLGYADRALAQARAAVALARTLNHPFSVAFSLSWESALHWFRRDPTVQRARAEEAIALSEAQGFPLWLGVAKAFHGAARASAGADATAVAEVSEGLALAAGTGNRGAAPALFALLAEAHHTVGQSAEAMAAVETGLALASETGQPFWDAALYRLKGEILLAAPEAEALFRRAIEIARAQEAKSLELRAATSLARLLRTHGKCQEARALLSEIYAWFTEGFDTRDLQDAKALLEEL